MLKFAQVVLFFFQIVSIIGFYLFQAFVTAYEVRILSVKW